MRITASVRRIEKGVTIEGGAGVGRITRPGLAMPVGEAAINPGPRQQIADAVHRAAQQNGYGGGFSVTISVKDPTKILSAISCGAVFMGANTYIGNAPNFMVKAISDENGVKMPSFFGYMLWSVAFLVPVFIIDMFVFFL